MPKPKPWSPPTQPSGPRGHTAKRQRIASGKKPQKNRKSA